MCPDAECLEKKFVVFESEMDLKAHQLEAHPSGLSKDARRDARRVDMSGFDYRAPHEQDRAGDSERRHRDRGRGGRGRGRDPNVEALPVSSAQPLRRDEVAYQRQLAVHSAQSVSNRTFGGQLTTSDVYAARPSSSHEPSTVSAPRPDGNNTATTNPSLPTSLDALTFSSTTPDTNPDTPQNRARTLRHTALLDRASSLCASDPSTLQAFRNLTSAYRISSTSASSLLDSLFALFPSRSPGEVGTLAKELAELYEIHGKREALLGAWSDWRAMHEGFPSLPGPAASSSDGPGSGGWAARAGNTTGAASRSSNTAPAGSSVGVGEGGARMLRLKSSMAQNSRSWAEPSASNANPSSQRQAAGSSRGADAFPSMPSSSTSSDAHRSAAAATSKPSWVATSSGKAQSALQGASQAQKRQGARQPGGADAFPALPAAAKPGMNVGVKPVIRDGGWSGRGAGVNAWANGLSGGRGGRGGVDRADDVGNGVEDEGGASGKRKGKKKQTLIHWG